MRTSAYESGFVSPICCHRSPLGGICWHSTHCRVGRWHSRCGRRGVVCTTSFAYASGVHSSVRCHGSGTIEFVGHSRSCCGCSEATWGVHHASVVTSSGCCCGCRRFACNSRPGRHQFGSNIDGRRTSVYPCSTAGNTKGHGGASSSATTSTYVNHGVGFCTTIKNNQHQFGNSNTA